MVHPPTSHQGSRLAGATPTQSRHHPPASFSHAHHVKPQELDIVSNGTIEHTAPTPGFTLRFGFQLHVFHEDLTIQTDPYPALVGRSAVMAPTQGLEDSMAKLSILGHKLDSTHSSEQPVIDDILHKIPRQGKRKRSHQAPDHGQLRRHLEDEFLLPSTSFSPEWLNRFQQYGSLIS